MFGLKIFVRVQTFRRRPFTPSHNFQYQSSTSCHPHHQYIYVFTSNVISICGLKRPTQKCQMWLTCIQDFFRLWQVFTPWEPISQFNSDEAFLYQQFSFSIISVFNGADFFSLFWSLFVQSFSDMYRLKKKPIVQNKMPWNEKALMRHWTLHHS